MGEVPAASFRWRDDVFAIFGSLGHLEKKSCPAPGRSLVPSNVFKAKVRTLFIKKKPSPARHAEATDHADEVQSLGGSWDPNPLHLLPHCVTLGK